MEVVLYCLELDSGSVSRGELDLGNIDADEPSPKVTLIFACIECFLLKISSGIYIFSGNHIFSPPPSPEDHIFSPF